MHFNYFKSFVLVFVLMARVAIAQTTVPALITSNQVWNPAGSPYIINQTTLIDTHATVTVLPGTVIKANNQRMYINGELQAIGTASSPIQIDSLEINFNNGSKDYNDSSLQGAFFKYCNFEGLGSGRHTIKTNTTSIRLDHCRFKNTYYSLYASSTSLPAHTIVENCDMAGDQYGEGYPLYFSGSKLSAFIQNNYFHDARNLYLTGEFQFIQNKTRYIKSFTAYINANTRVSCNEFKYMNLGFEASINSYANPVDIYITNNTFDTVGGKINGTTTYYPMLKLNRYASAYLYRVLEVSGNNFLYIDSPDKVVINGSNPSPTKYDTLNFRSNYWGSTDTTAIKSMIKDYSDDIMIFGKADFSNFLSGPDTSCQLSPTSCPTSINFYYSTNAKTISLTNTSTGGNDYKIYWYFDDGNADSTNRSQVNHTYGEAGTYVISLVIYDANGRFCGVKYDTVDLSPDTGCLADFYLAVDTTKSFNLFIVNSSKGITSNTQFYWSFGDGTGSSQRNPTHTYNSFGLFQLCLTIYDSSQNCYSTYCDSIGLDSLGKLLKQNGFTIQVIDETELSVNDKMAHSGKVSLYPNPAKNQLNVRLTGFTEPNAELQLFNQFGQFVFSSGTVNALSGEDYRIDLSTLPAGMYVLYVKTEAKTQSIKVIKL